MERSHLIRRRTKTLIAQYSLQPTNKPKIQRQPARDALALKQTKSQEGEQRGWVVVVHTLLISLICWVKHKLVYTSVSCGCLCLRFEFFILWQSVVAWSSWVEWCMTVSFLSLWVVVNCVPLESFLVVLLVSCEGLVSQSEVSLWVCTVPWYWVCLSQSMSLSVYQWDETVFDSELSFSWIPSYSCHFRLVGWC